jgi:hypothetical protein
MRKPRPTQIIKKPPIQVQVRRVMPKAVRRNPYKKKKGIPPGQIVDYYA